MKPGTKREALLFFYCHLAFFLSSIVGSSGEECPTECFCPQGTTSTTCIGDKTLTSLPLLNITNDAQAKGHRLEIRDYLLPVLDPSPSDRRLFFQTVNELVLAHNQIERIHFERELMGEEPIPIKDSTEFKLRVLDLSNNNLREFSSSPELSSLKSLDLSHNVLVKVNLSGLNTLESLNLRSNALEDLSPNTFEALESLHYINLDSNRLQTLAPHLFSHLQGLAHLILSSNPLQLPPGFIFNARTQFIDISHVGLVRVPPSLTTTVRDLRLNNNNLSSIGQTDFESFPNLALLVLDENKIEMIEDDALGRMEFLTGLWINGNRLSRIPQNLPTSLKSLQLEENRIAILHQSDFHPLSNLETLNLHGNRVESLDPFVFSPLVRLRTLILRANKIDSLLPALFSNLSALQILDLSQNPLKVIVNGAFNPLTHLHILHLSRLGEMDVQFEPSHLFPPLLHLQILDLNNSPYFSKKALPGLGLLKSLRELNVDACNLDMAQLLIICDQIQGLESVRVIKGARNPFGRANGTTRGLAVYIPAKICPSPPIPSPILPSTSSMSPTPVEIQSTTQVSLTSRGNGEATTTNLPPTTNSPKETWTSSYFFPSGSILETNEETGRKQSEDGRRNQEDRDEVGSIDGFPVGAEPGSPHSLPQRMLLRSPPIYGILANAQSKESTTDGRGLILRTILISGVTCMLSVFLLLGIGLFLFKLNGGRLLGGRTRREQNPNSYERLEDKQEVELGISNRVYYNGHLEDGQVFTIS